MVGWPNRAPKMRGNDDAMRREIARTFTKTGRFIIDAGDRHTVVEGDAGLLDVTRSLAKRHYCDMSTSRLELLEATRSQLRVLFHFHGVIRELEASELDAPNPSLYIYGALNCTLDRKTFLFEEAIVVREGTIEMK